MLTIAPPPRARRCGAEAFVVRNVVRRFCDSHASHALAAIPSTRPPPAGCAEVPAAAPPAVGRAAGAAEPQTEIRDLRLFAPLDGEARASRELAGELEVVDP